MVLLYIISLFSGTFGALAIIHFGKKAGLLDRPNARSSHHVPTPKGGGIGILAAFLLTSLCLGIPVTFWFPASIVALLGFYGDKKDISPRFRLYLQFFCAFIVLFGIREQYPTSVYLLLILPMAVFIVGTTNFYNFMDGIHGIAGITGIVGFSLLALFLWFSGKHVSFMTLALCLSFSCAGFLPLNFPNAQVFLGDVGSILLGFVFSGMVIFFSKTFLDFLCLAAFLFPFYADELTTMIVRIRGGENLTQPHRRHLYQLLANEYGIAHWKISVVYGAIQLIVGGSLLLGRTQGMLIVLLMLSIYSCSFIGVTWIFRKKLTS